MEGGVSGQRHNTAACRRMGACDDVWVGRVGGGERREGGEGGERRSVALDYERSAGVWSDAAVSAISQEAASE